MRWRAHRTHAELSDEQCIELYRSERNAEVLGALFDRYVPLIFGVCLKYLKHSQASEDATMEIFEVLQNKLLNHQVDTFKSWLFVVVKNHCLQILRKRNTSLLTEDYELQDMQSDALVHPFDEDEKDLLQDGLMQCVDKLPDGQKQSIELFYFQAKSYQEIAEIMALDKEQIRSNLQNGRRNLRSCMEQQKKNSG